MSITKVDEEIMSVVSLLHQAAVATIPPHKSKANNFIHDDEKCQMSKSAWRKWRDAGWPIIGPFHQQIKNEVKSHVRKCRAKQEWITIQARDEMFKTKDEQCFSIHQWKTECSKLVVNGVWRQEGVGGQWPVSRTSQEWGSGPNCVAKAHIQHTNPTLRCHQGPVVRVSD